MRRPIKILALACLVLGAAASAAAAAGNLTVELNGSRRVVLPGIAANVVVGDPQVADVTLTDAHSIILTGKGYGATQLIVTDHGGRTLLDGLVTVVSPNDGRVTVYRGVSATEMACGGMRCHAAVHGGGDGGAGGASVEAAPAAVTAATSHP